MRSVVFFDVDYTLIKAPPQHRAVLAEVFSELFKVDFSAEDFRGKVEPGFTDRELFRVALIHKGFEGSMALLEMEKISSITASKLLSLLTVDGVELLPGVEPLLRLLKEMGFELALFTGNVKKVAWVKVSVAGIADFFSWGVFGDEADSKVELAKLALARARLRLGSPVSLFLVGDATRDVLAGKAMGALVVGVSTGPSSAEELAEAGADLVVPDLMDLDRLAKFFGGAIA